MRATGNSGGRGGGPLALFFLFFYVFPVGILVAVSLRSDTLPGAEWTLGNYTALLTHGFTLSILADTLRLGLEVALVTLLIAYPLGLLYAGASPRLRTVLLFLILLPLLTNTVVRTFAWMVILGRQGVINDALIGLGLWQEPARLLYTRPGLVVALAQIYLPLMVLPINNALLRIDPNLLKASEGLGASRFFTLRTVTIPLSLPGVIAGCLLTFAGTTTAFITQTLVGGGRQIFVPLLIYQQSIGVQKWTSAAALSVAFAVLVMAIVYAVNRFTRLRLRGVDA